jgi:hypothetical protein
MDVFGRQAACFAVVTAATLSSVAGADLNHGVHLVRGVQNAVTDALIGPDYTSAAFELDRYHEIAGTYAGAELPARSMTLRLASATFYCVEGRSASGTVSHLIGPRGSRAPGSCPG